jgi:predicted amidohydrolase
VQNGTKMIRAPSSTRRRAIENQCFVVLSGNVGNLPGVDNMDVQYAQSCILTPCDFPFARDGIAAEASENIETLTIADVNLADLTWARAEGTVRNLSDRRFDLYRIDWQRGERSEQPAAEGRPMGSKAPGGG